MPPSFSNTTDFDNATRGLVSKLDPCMIYNSDGRQVWDNETYSFLNSECPPTADPKLWRQGQLNSIQGLFELAAGVYQIRGFDLSNMTIVEGETGIIITDPLTTREPAAAALQLYREHRGNRPVKGLIYSHSHVDHFGGAAGVLPDDHTSIPIIAPEGFMEEVLSENVFAGPAMRRRAKYMYGGTLPKEPKGQIGCGLGQTTSQGTTSLIPPDTLITHTGEELVVDGVSFTFQLVPETEAPAELNFYLSKQRVLYIAECATHCMHNIITLRGAQVRDAKSWSRHLDETLVMFTSPSHHVPTSNTSTTQSPHAPAQVLCAGHNWPIWTTAAIRKHIATQRDLYAYMHDQTLRLMNRHALTGTEIAEELSLPPGLDSDWSCQGFYGSLSHNVKGIYQRYMTWFDGDAVNLWKYPKKEEGVRYVRCFDGGIEGLLRKAEMFVKEGDHRFAATLLGHAVAAEPDHKRARLALAEVLEKLGFGAENATWRNFYLTTAMELRSAGGQEVKVQKWDTREGLNPMLSVEQWFATLSVQIDGIRAAEHGDFVIALDVVDAQERWWLLILSNGALTYRALSGASAFHESPDLKLALKKMELRALLSRDRDVDAVGRVVEGRPELFGVLVSLAHDDGSAESKGIGGGQAAKSANL